MKHTQTEIEIIKQGLCLWNIQYHIKRLTEQFTDKNVDPGILLKNGYLKHLFKKTLHDMAVDKCKKEVEEKKELKEVGKEFDKNFNKNLDNLISGKKDKDLKF